MLQTRKVLHTVVRCSSSVPIPVEIPRIPSAGSKKKYPIKKPDGGIEYYRFTYYPRNPDQQDPPYTPAKVHMVERIAKLKGRPYWEKDIMKKLGLDEDSKGIAIVPNTPQRNADLWTVKHLIRITPITFPQGLPKDGDLSGARLKENGELTFIPQLKGDTAAAEKQAAVPVNPSFMDGPTLAKHLRLKWIKPWD